MAETLNEAWFVAPTAVREKLRTRGIVPNPDIHGDEVWLFDDRELAEMAARVTVTRGGYLSTPDGMADVWHVDVSGLAVTHHAHIQNMENVQHVGSVEPDRLLLHATF